MEHKRGLSLVGMGCIGLMLVVGCFGCASGGKQQADSTEPPPVAKMPPPPPSPIHAHHLKASPIPFYPTPKNMDLCGEAVPLQSQEVLERFDKEFTLIVYNHAQVFLWLKRMERYFPSVEQRLRSLGLPDDLKYVAIAESDLLPNACSPKGAAGPWQFMPATGTQYGLSQRGSCDERYDFERSTDSAFRYLRDLNRRFNNWSLAIAAYNCGERRVQDEMRSQGISSYYQLKLPLETERYVMRILAIKAVLSSPSQYGYTLPKGEGYPELKVDRISYSTSRPVSLQTLASAAGITYREMKMLNPAIRSDSLQAGAYELKLPKGTEQAFRRNMDGGSTGTQPAFSTPAAPEVKYAGAAYQTREYADTESFQSAYDESQAQDVSDSYEAEQPSRPSSPARSTPPSQTRVASADKHAKSTGPTYHTVARGETLYSIARHYGVSVNELRSANKLKGSTVSQGQKLKVPEG